MHSEEWYQSTLGLDVFPPPLEVELKVGINPDGTRGHATVWVRQVPDGQLVAGGSRGPTESMVLDERFWLDCAMFALDTARRARGPFD